MFRYPEDWLIFDMDTDPDTEPVSKCTTIQAYAAQLTPVTDSIVDQTGLTFRWLDLGQVAGLLRQRTSILTLCHWLGMNFAVVPVKQRTHYKTSQKCMMCNGVLLRFMNPSLNLQVRELLSGIRKVDKADIKRAAIYSFEAKVATRWQDGQIFLLGEQV